MRSINVDEIITCIKNMCIEANFKLASDVDVAIREAYDKESSLESVCLLNSLTILI